MMASLYSPSGKNSYAGETENLIAFIRGRVSPEAVFLLGREQASRNTTSIFLDSGITASYPSHYYLLLLVEKDDEHTAACVQDKLENSSQYIVPLTVMVLSTTAFVRLAGEGQQFATTVLRKASLLYKSETFLLPIPAPANKEQRKAEASALYTQAADRVEAFLTGADLYRLRKEYGMAAFMLHQAAEQALRTLLMIGTGYRPHTHSIDKLLRYGMLICPQLAALFPRQSEGDKKIFSLLRKAYIDSRYKEEYTITAAELAQLEEKVHRIQALFKKQGAATAAQLTKESPAHP
ncbi:MAG TPA: HEPN domain-containing protein [Flavisolibacter sp.]|jgi:HEPN domain-containing protein|nr:HEPN domain-containing protein [Flavisolibacter sp.]